MTRPTRRVPTEDGLHWQQVQLERNLRAANHALAAMRRGQTLHLQHIGGRRRCSLSNGESVPAAVANIIINNTDVAPANDGLFPDLLAQTWRMK